MHIFRFSFQHNHKIIIFGRVSNIRYGSFVKWPTEDDIVYSLEGYIDLSLSVPHYFFTALAHCRLTDLRFNLFLSSIPLGNSIFMYFSSLSFILKCSMFIHNETLDTILNQAEKLKQASTNYKWKCVWEEE